MTWPTDFSYDERDVPPGVTWSIRSVLKSLVAGEISEEFEAFFDRDPERTSPSDPGLVVSPADGLVEVRRPVGRPPEFVVHLRLTDVHVQRVPFPGRVASVVTAGRGHFYPDDPHYLTGVQAITSVTSSLGIYRVRLITTLITRRLETYLVPDREVVTGERLGRIRLGSTVILELPGAWESLVEDRQRVFGGVTPLARVL